MVKNFLNLQEERNEKLLMKCLLAWVKVRFIVPMKYDVPKIIAKEVKELAGVERLSKAAIISEEDAWVIEKNACLFNVISKNLMNKILSKDIYRSYGAPTVMTDRKNSIMDIALLPPSFETGIAEIMPCSLFIMKKSKLVEQCKENKSYITDKHIDIIPMLKVKITDFLNLEQLNYINELYDLYKADEEILKAKQIVIDSRAREEQNLNAILKVINRQKDSTNIVKLGITLYTVIKHAYGTTPQTVMKIRYGANGANPVMQFSKLFNIEYEIDLEIIKNILGPLLNNEIKIRVHENLILFTTGSEEPSDENAMEKIFTTDIKDEAALDFTFETYVSPMVSMGDINRIMQKFLTYKYRSYYK